MAEQLDLNLYRGKGEQLTARGGALSDYQPLQTLEDPKNYMAGKGLRDAVNVALALGQPLLITGEPGTGKTRLADSMAWELGLPKLTFHTKTTSTAKDLFYRYDSLKRFQDAQLPGQKHMSVNDYITYEALGLAILLTNPPQQVNEYLPENLRDTGPSRSLVLVDEIDKAPRDLPNDVLNEIEEMRFNVRETGKTFTADQRLRPVVLLTSNSEKNLPDAFLRRCVFYHIPFPSREELKQIVRKRLGEDSAFAPGVVDAALDTFQEIRDLALKKPPATAELLDWLRILKSMNLQADDIKSGQAETFALSFSLLAKDNEDLAKLKRKFAGK